MPGWRSFLREFVCGFLKENKITLGTIWILEGKFHPVPDINSWVSEQHLQSMPLSDWSQYNRAIPWDMLGSGAKAHLPGTDA